MDLLKGLHRPHDRPSPSKHDSSSSSDSSGSSSDHKRGQQHHGCCPRCHKTGHDNHHCSSCKPQASPPACPPHKPCDVNVNVNLGPITCCTPGSKGSDPGTGTPPGRPVHNSGTSDNTIDDGAGGPGGIVKIPQRPPNVWPGPRNKLWMPYLFIRAVAGDMATRPIQGVFWESPDIFVLPGVAPEDAPAKPPKLGGVAKSGDNNTVYAHVWNLGVAPAYQALIEFYWFDPSLGFNGKGAHLIGKTSVDLNGCGQPNSHRMVKCPRSWVAQYLNGGHECLVVRVSHPVTDPLSEPPWDASQNRHIGQRNLHVMSAEEAAAKPTLGINIGPVYGQQAKVNVARADAGTMPWLHLVTGSRTQTFGTAAITGDVGITQAMVTGGGLPNLGAVPNPRGVGLIGNEATIEGDDKQVGFVATDGQPGNGQAHVYRVSGQQGGTTFGGYTVVVLGK